MLSRALHRSLHQTPFPLTVLDPTLDPQRALTDAKGKSLNGSGADGRGDWSTKPSPRAVLEPIGSGTFGEVTAKRSSSSQSDPAAGGGADLGNEASGGGEGEEGGPATIAHSKCEKIDEVLHNNIAVTEQYLEDTMGVMLRTAIGRFEKHAHLVHLVKHLIRYQ